MKRHGLQVWDKLFGWKRRAEARATLHHVHDFVPPGSVVLDIGCGAGYLLEVVTEERGCIGLGCDVVQQPVPIDRFTIFDGFRLPYADQSVDVAFLVFVLHHADDPGILLREAARVARQAVIVVEDTPQAAFEQRWGAFHVHSFGKRHNIPWDGRVRSAQEWHQVFQFTGMPVCHAEHLGRFERLPPVSRTAFVLEPPFQQAAAAASLDRVATS
jgi:ubiquinone/menaquinone biosynthesis C-methylase UbiE